MVLDDIIMMVEMGEINEVFYLLCGFFGIEIISL